MREASAAQILAFGSRFLRRASASPALDARVLLALAMDLPADVMVTGLTGLAGKVPFAARQRFTGFLRRRAKGEPVSRIRAMREFWSLTFMLSPDVLDPRPESETLVEAALALAPPDAALRVLELGAGSGALLLAFLTERPRARGVGVDRSKAAVAIARANARQLGLATRACFFTGNWGKALAGGFDLVLANPPYIPCREIPRLPPDVRQFDPLLALDGGKDGLCAYRALAPDLPRLLGPEGRAIMEIGAGQAKPVAALLASAGLKLYDSKNDLAGCPRAQIFGHPNA